MGKLTVKVSVKDTELFKKLCEVTVFLLDKANQETRTTATKQLVDAGIIEDPGKVGKGANSQRG